MEPAAGSTRVDTAQSGAPGFEPESRGFVLGAEQISHLAITRAHERVVNDLEEAGLDHAVVRPSGYFSDMGAVLDMARRAS